MVIANFVIITVILLLLCVFAATFFVLWHHDKKRRAAAVPDDAEKSSDSKVRAKWLEKVVDHALKALNCQTEWTSEKGAREVIYDYQNGHFRIRIQPESPYVKLSYLFCYTSPAHNLDVARVVCNQCNANSNNERVVYSINEEKNEVDVHILAGLLVGKDNAKEVLAASMRDIFGWQQAFSRRFEDLTKEADDDSNDTEKSVAQRRRSLFLLRQQEMNMQHSGPIRVNNTDRLRLGQFLDKALGITEVIPHYLDIYSDNTTRLFDHDQILDADLLDPDCEMMRLGYETGQRPVEPQCMMIMLNDAGDDGQTSYRRITACIEPCPPKASQPFAFSHSDTQATSVIVARDRVSPQQKIDEFNYMWKEALQKAKNGELDKLTREQRLICECTDIDIAKSLYEGKKLYLAKRYYEALLHLENAYRRMVGDYDQMGRQKREAFFDVAYMVGFCYSELRLFDKAAFYLDMLSGLRRVDYTEEYVNCLVNAKDIRALAIIEEYIQQLQPDDDEEPEPHVLHFINFLRRRKAFVLVDKKRYQEARQLLNDMLDEPDNADFAISELAYLQQLEKEN